MAADSPRRGEVYLCDFRPARGSEQGGVRPAVIVERDAFAIVPAKRHVLVAAVTTSSRGQKLPFCVPLPAGRESGLARDSWLNASHVHAFAKERLQKRLGALSQEEMARVDEALRLVFDL